MIKLAAFDLDGTLTQHKSKLTAAGRAVLTELTRRYRLVMVCAGGCERVYRQMDGFPIDIIGFYGMEYASAKDKGQAADRVRVENDRQSVLRNMEYIREQFGFEDYTGESVEFHDSGIITLPLLGTRAPLEQKLAFDPDRAKRRSCYEQVCGLFAQYNVFIGGSSSFDIAPKPYRKLYALERYMGKLGFDPSEVVYFGDDYGLGGNDSDIYHSDIRFVPIDYYCDFPKTAKDVLL